MYNISFSNGQLFDTCARFFISQPDLYFFLEKMCEKSQCKFIFVSNQILEDFIIMEWNSKNDILSQIDEFKIESSGFSSLVTKKGLIYLNEKDINGRLKLKTLIINGIVVHHQTFDYDLNNKLVKHSIKSQNYTFHKAGFLKYVLPAKMLCQPLSEKSCDSA